MKCEVFTLLHNQLHQSICERSECLGDLVLDAVAAISDRDATNQILRVSSGSSADVLPHCLSDVSSSSSVNSFEGRVMVFMMLVELWIVYQRLSTAASAISVSSSCQV